MPSAWAHSPPSLPAKYHKEAEEEEGRDSLDISTAAAASALVSLAANQPAGNLALRAPRESEQGKKRGDRQSYGQTERYTCRTPQTRVRRRGGEGKRRTSFRVHKHLSRGTSSRGNYSLVPISHLSTVNNLRFKIIK